jgi:hypothetical protein
LSTARADENLQRAAVSSAARSGDAEALEHLRRVRLAVRLATPRQLQAHDLREANDRLL